MAQSRLSVSSPAGPSKGVDSRQTAAAQHPAARPSRIGFGATARNLAYSLKLKFSEPPVTPPRCEENLKLASAQLQAVKTALTDLPRGGFLDSKQMQRLDASLKPAHRSVGEWEEQIASATRHIGKRGLLKAKDVAKAPMDLSHSLSDAVENRLISPAQARNVNDGVSVLNGHLANAGVLASAAADHKRGPASAAAQPQPQPQPQAALSAAAAVAPAMRDEERAAAVAALAPQQPLAPFHELRDEAIKSALNLLGVIGETIPFRDERIPAKDAATRFVDDALDAATAAGQWDWAAVKKSVDGKGWEFFARYLYKEHNLVESTGLAFAAFQKESSVEDALALSEFEHDKASLLRKKEDTEFEEALQRSLLDAPAHDAGDRLDHKHAVDRDLDNKGEALRVARKEPAQIVAQPVAFVPVAESGER